MATVSEILPGIAMGAELPPFVVARFKPFPVIYNFYDTQQAADARKAALDAEGRDVGYGAMKTEDYFSAERRHYLGDGIKRIDSDRFNEMLNVLPPMRWMTRGDLECFLMCEFTAGPYTSQFARLFDEYFEATVHHRDETTWISVTKILAFKAVEQAAEQESAQ